MICSTYVYIVIRNDGQDIDVYATEDVARQAASSGESTYYLGPEPIMETPLECE